MLENSPGPSPCRPKVWRCSPSRPNTRTSAWSLSAINTSLSGPRTALHTSPNSSGPPSPTRSVFGPMETTGVSCHSGAVPVLVTRMTPSTVSIVVVRSPAIAGESAAQPVVKASAKASGTKANADGMSRIILSSFPARVGRARASLPTPPTRTKVASQRRSRCRIPRETHHPRHSASNRASVARSRPVRHSYPPAASRLRCQSSVSFAITASGRNVSPAAIPRLLSMRP